jgi:hypothetical protein
MEEKQMSKHLTKNNFEDKVREFYKEISEGGKPNSQCEYLMSLLNFKIDMVESKNKKSKYINYVLKISILLLAGLSTVILGLKSEVFTFSSDSWRIQPADIVLIFSATITFFSGLAAFWDVENYQMRTKIMVNRLKELRYKFTLEATRENRMNSRELEKVMEEFINIIGDGYWERKYLQRLDQEKIIPKEKEDNNN